MAVRTILFITVAGALSACPIDAGQSDGGAADAGLFAADAGPVAADAGPGAPGFVPDDAAPGAHLALDLVAVDEDAQTVTLRLAAHGLPPLFGLAGRLVGPGLDDAQVVETARWLGAAETHTQLWVRSPDALHFGGAGKDPAAGDVIVAEDATVLAFTVPFSDEDRSIRCTRLLVKDATGAVLGARCAGGTITRGGTP